MIMINNVQIQDMEQNKRMFLTKMLNFMMEEHISITSVSYLLTSILCAKVHTSHVGSLPSQHNVGKCDQQGMDLFFDAVLACIMPTENKLTLKFML